MTIDEAIAHAREVAKRNREQWKNCPAERDTREHLTCEECAEEHEQLAEWLEELKFIKQWKADIMEGFCKYDASSFEEIVYNARNKAIDEFITRAYRKLGCSEKELYCSDVIDEIAEQMKAGGKNE